MLHHRPPLFESAPILLLIFNRPDFARQSFEAIRKIRPKRLFIAADGPRNPAEKLRCEQARNETRNVDWECEVFRLEREQNMGCKIAVSSALSWFFAHEEEGIILEDDCIPTSAFFHYCTKLLGHYRGDERIGIISGDNFQKKPCAASYYFSRFPHVWGWASWRRFWKLYDVNIPGWNGAPKSLAPAIGNPRARQHIAQWFDGVRTGQSWALPLMHLCLQTETLCINPSRNLVENIGFGNEATHTKSTGSHPTPPAGCLEFPLRHPRKIKIDEKADSYTLTHVFNIQPNSSAARLKSWRYPLKKRWKKLREFVTSVPHPRLLSRQQSSETR